LQLVVAFADDIQFKHFVADFLTNLGITVHACELLQYGTLKGGILDTHVSNGATDAVDTPSLDEWLGG
jgi:hypothetical protein